MATEEDADEEDAPAEPAPVAAQAKPKAAPVKKEASDGPKEPSIAQQSIRVSVGLLEGLMTLVSELVLTRNQLLQMVRGQDDSEFNVPLQRLSLITSDLQEGVMKTRMQPIGKRLVEAAADRPRPGPWNRARRSISRCSAPRPSWIGRFSN